jgi:pantothenate kinase-related protein Tda10
MSKPLLVLVRGPSGSGKTTAALALIASGVVKYHFETDQLFVDSDGDYCFDHTMLGKYHAKNLKRVENTMKFKLPIVVSNTFIKMWEMQPYLDLADKHGYEVRVQEPNTEWRNNVAKCHRMNEHNVPLEAVRRQMKGFEKFVKGASNA